MVGPIETGEFSVFLVLSLLLIYVMGLVKVFIWSVTSRLARIKTGATIARSLYVGGQDYWRHSWRLVGLTTGFVILQLFLVAAYWVLETSSGMITPGLILVFFAIQQAFIFFRIQIRQMMYASISLVTGAA